MLDNYAIGIRPTHGIDFDKALEILNECIAIRNGQAPKK